MKHTTLYPFCFLFAVLATFSAASTHAQDTWVTYSKYIDIKNLDATRFRFESSVRAELTDDSAAARLWARVDKVGGVGFLENMMNSPIRSNKWNKYVIEGKIDSGSTQLALGAICTYNGRFYYDDMKVDILTKEGQWINLFKADFEDAKNPLKQGYMNKHFTARLTTLQKSSGTKSLVIESTKVPNYGNNKNAGKFADVNGIKLYYEVYGQGAPLLVLHGNGGSIENASTFYPDLIKNFKVIAVDSRAQGRSGDSQAPLTYEQMADDVNDLLDQLKLDSVLIWGQSDGAILGIILALDHPKKVRKLLAFGCNIQKDSLAVYNWAITGTEKIFKESKDPKEKKLNQLMIDHPNIDYSRLATINAPVLLVNGDRDVIRPEHTLQLFRNIPNSQMCIIPGATHGAAWEKKDFFLTIMNDFFKNQFTMPDTKAWY